MSEAIVENNEKNDVKILKAKTAHLEKVVWVGSSIVTIIVFIASFFGINAWSSISAKIDKLNNDADKVETRYNDLNKQMLAAGQSNVALNTQLSGLSMEIAKKYDELLQRFTELKALAAKAQLESERAMNCAGMLADAVKSANVSADRANELAIKAQNASKTAESASVNIQKNIQLMDEFLAKNLVMPKINTFKVTITGDYSSFIISAGNAIPYDRKFSGTSAKAHIAVPGGCSVIVNDSGTSNKFFISEKVKDSVIIEGNGDYRTVKFGDFVFN